MIMVPVRGANLFLGLLLLPVATCLEEVYFSRLRGFGFNVNTLNTVSGGYAATTATPPASLLQQYYTTTTMAPTTTANAAVQVAAAQANQAMASAQANQAMAASAAVASSQAAVSQAAASSAAAVSAAVASSQAAAALAATTTQAPTTTTLPTTTQQPIRLVIEAPLVAEAKGEGEPTEEPKPMKLPSVLMHPAVKQMATNVADASMGAIKDTLPVIKTIAEQAAQAAISKWARLVEEHDGPSTSTTQTTTTIAPTTRAATTPPTTTAQTPASTTTKPASVAAAAMHQEPTTMRQDRPDIAQLGSVDVGNTADSQWKNKIAAPPSSLVKGVTASQGEPNAIHDRRVKDGDDKTMRTGAEQRTRSPPRISVTTHVPRNKAVRKGPNGHLLGPARSQPQLP